MENDEGGRKPTTLPKRLAENPTYAAITAILLGIVGFALLFLSVTGDRLWWLVLWFLLGIALLAVSLLYLNDEMAERLERRTAVPWWWWAVFGGLSAVGVVILALSMWREWSPILAAPFVMVTAIGMIGIHVGATVRAAGSSPPGPPSGPPDGGGLVVRMAATVLRTWVALGLRVQIGLALLALGVVVVSLASGFGAVSWLALVGWLIGLILVKIGVARFLKARRGSMQPTMLVLGGAAVVGVAAAYLGGRWSSQPLLLAGMTLVVVALSVLGLAAVHCECSARLSSALLIGGIVGIVFVTAWVVLIVSGFDLGVVVAAFVWGIGTWYVFRGEGIVLILLVGYIAVWGLLDRTTDEPTDPHAGAPVRMLALGDSFISGEGADEFFSGTNVVGDERNECRRAATAYPYLVADELGYSLDFVACSGAKAADLTVCGQMAPEDERCRSEERDWDDVRGVPTSAPAGARPQLANYTPQELMEFDVVLLSIGGNDVGFSDIVQACLLPKGCEEREELWIANVRDKLGLLRATYARVRDATPDTTPIIVMPYPMLVTDEECELGLSEDEHGFVVRFITALDGTLRDAARAEGVHFFEPSITAFAEDGVQLCDDDAGANHLQLSPPEGSWVQRYLPSAWIHNSMHPNEIGHRSIANRLVPYVGDLMAEIEQGAAANPAPADVVVDSPSEDERRDAEAGAAAISNGEWITEELFRTARALALPLALLLVSGMMLAVGIVRKDWWLGNALRPRDAQL